MSDLPTVKNFEVMEMFKRISFFFATVLLCTSMSSAATLNVTETTDYSNVRLPSLSSIGTTEAGSNFVAGSISGACDFVLFCVGADTADHFAFSVGPNQLLSSVTFQNVGAGPGALSFHYSLSKFSGGTFTPVAFTVSGLNGTGFLSNVDLGQGTYFIGVYEDSPLNGISADNFGLFNVNWTATLKVGNTVAPIPVPAAGLLLLGGLGGLGLMRHRKYSHPTKPVGRA